MKMNDLMSRIEAAEVGDEFDLVREAVNIAHQPETSLWTRAHGLIAWAELRDMPEALIGAALTLVPEGWVWNVSVDYELPGRACLHCALPGGPDDPPISFKADAATPALALCAAVLRAREDG